MHIQIMTLVSLTLVKETLGSGSLLWCNMHFFLFLVGERSGKLKLMQEEFKHKARGAVIPPSLFVCCAMSDVVDMSSCSGKIECFMQNRQW